jgi:hypothetical protein
MTGMILLTGLWFVFIRRGISWTSSAGDGFNDLTIRKRTLF